MFTFSDGMKYLENGNMVMATDAHVPPMTFAVDRLFSRALLLIPTLICHKLLFFSS